MFKLENSASRFDRIDKFGEVVAKLKKNSPTLLCMSRFLDILLCSSNMTVVQTKLGRKGNNWQVVLLADFGLKRWTTATTEEHRHCVQVTKNNVSYFKQNPFSSCPNIL